MKMTVNYLNKVIQSMVLYTNTLLTYVLGHSLQWLLKQLKILTQIANLP